MVAALIEMELRTKFKMPFHVIVLNEAPPWFRAEVLGNGVKLYEKEVGLASILFKAALEEKNAMKHF